MALRELRRKFALICCKLYISDSQNPIAVGVIRKAAEGHRLAPLLHVFEDKEYNRIGYTVAGALPLDEKLWSPSLVDLSQEMCGLPLSPLLPLQATVIEIVRAALACINLEDHIGSHPRLGVVDHLCFHPLGSASMEQVASLARSVAEEIGSNLQVPTFLYGSAQQEGRQLDAIRRTLGYFRSNSEGQWAGASELNSYTLSPDFGPAKASPKAGVVVVGASPWVMNYNVPISSTNLTIGRRIARRVSHRGGGLAEVQAMALLHGDDGIEIACNMLNVSITTPEMVQELVARLAHQHGLECRQGYLTGYTATQVLDLALSKLLPDIS